MKRYAYYISCINESVTKELDASLELWKSEMGLEFEKLHDGTCCGGSNLEYVNPDQFLLVNGRNIALAEKMGLDLVTSCNTCLLTLRKAKQELDESEEKRAMVNKFLANQDLEYTGKSDVKHLLWVLNEDIGLDAVKSKVKKPLKGMRIAPFYGCHILRPSDLFGRDDPYAPKSLDMLVEALGGETVEYKSKNKCCGFHTMMVAEEESYKVACDALEDGVESGADYIVTPCPLCHWALDANQKPAVASQNKKHIKIPVLHLSQIVGLALGYTEEQLGIDKHMITR